MQCHPRPSLAICDFYVTGSYITAGTGWYFLTDLVLVRCSADKAATQQLSSAPTVTTLIKNARRRSSPHRKRTTCGNKSPVLTLVMSQTDMGSAPMTDCRCGEPACQSQPPSTKNVTDPVWRVDLRSHFQRWHQVNLKIKFFPQDFFLSNNLQVYILLIFYCQAYRYRYNF